MAVVNYKALVEGYAKAGVNQAEGWLAESFQERAVRPQDFDIGRLFVECFGWHDFVACRGERSNLVCGVMEAAGAVSTASFLSISKQVVLTAIRDSFMAEEFIFSKIVPDKPSQIIGKEKVGDISDIGDEAMVVPEGQPYPLAGVNADWISWPEAVKRGLIVALTREAIFSDATGKLIEKCSKRGAALGLNKEKRIIDCIIDENGGAVSTPTGHRYCWKDTYIATYGDNSGTHSWDNLEATNALVDGTDIDAAEQLLNGMTDPSTGEPIVLNGTSLICTKQLEKTALRIKVASSVIVTQGGFATSGNPVQFTGGNPYAKEFEVICSRLFAARLGTDTSWFYGDPRKAFAYKTIFPLQTLEAGPNSQKEFEQDIVNQYRADEMGAAMTIEPRAMTKCTA